MVNEENLEGKLESDFSKLDYEHPILLRPEYKGLQVTGNFDLQTAERILRRQFGIIRKVKPQDFERIERVLNNPPHIEGDHTYSLASTDVRYKVMIEGANPNPWINFGISKILDDDNEKPQIRIKAYYPRFKELLKDVTSKEDKFKYNLRKPVKTTLFGIPMNINALTETPSSDEISLNAEVFT